MFDFERKNSIEKGKNVDGESGKTRKKSGNSGCKIWQTPCTIEKLGVHLRETFVVYQ